MAQDRFRERSTQRTLSTKTEKDIFGRSSSELASDQVQPFRTTEAMPHAVQTFPVTSSSHPQTSQKVKKTTSDSSPHLKTLTATTAMQERAEGSGRDAA